MKRIVKIVITGGPCGGKTTAMSWLKRYFSGKGYYALFVPESATELINGGVTPQACGLLDYERCEIPLQLKKERLFEFAAQVIENDRIIIVCDRGVHDNKAWMTDEEFDSVLFDEGTDKHSILNSYDAVFHLVSAAKGAEKFYTLENNGARKETLEEAAILDDDTISAWSDHRHFIVIDNSTGFEEKMERLIEAIDSFLNDLLA